jgi:hypothetical protein
LDEPCKPRIEERDGKLFVEGDERGYTRKTVLEVRGNGVFIADANAKSRDWSNDLHFIADDIRLEFENHLTTGYSSRNLHGIARLTTGQLKVLGEANYDTRKVNFDLRGPWSGWPDWSGTIAFLGSESNPDAWFLDAHLPALVFEDLVGAYQRDALVRLAFSIDSELWRHDRPNRLPGSYYEDDGVWYYHSGRRPGLALVRFDWSEKSKPIIAHATSTRREDLKEQPLEVALRWIMGLLGAIALMLFFLLLRH